MTSLPAAIRRCDKMIDDKELAPYYLEIEQDKKKKAAEDMKRAEQEIEELKKKYPDLAN